MLEEIRVIFGRMTETEERGVCESVLLEQD